MDRIRFVALVRGVEREAARRGYRGDALADPDDVPDCGTLRQEDAAACLWLDIQPRPKTERERRLLHRLCRAVVLTSAMPQPKTRPAARRARKW